MYIMSLYVTFVQCFQPQGGRFRNVHYYHYYVPPADRGHASQKNMIGRDASLGGNLFL